MSLLLPDTTAWARYDTHNVYTSRGKQGRRITVLRKGNIDETEYDMNSSKEGQPGVWVDDNVLKNETFYFYDRLFDVV